MDVMSRILKSGQNKLAKKDYQGVAVIAYHQIKSQKNVVDQIGIWSNLMGYHFITGVLMDHYKWPLDKIEKFVDLVCEYTKYLKLE